MSLVHIDSISIKNPKSPLNHPIELQITFTATSKLSNPITWKILYVGSAFSEEFDQILQQFQIGPINQACTMNFNVQCAPPIFSKIPKEELMCTTALLISVSSKDEEFVRIGYYVHNSFVGDAQEYGELSLEELVNNSQRVIIQEKPRITKFEINWQNAIKESQNQADKQNRQLSRKLSQNGELEVSFRGTVRFDLCESNSLSQNQPQQIRDKAESDGKVQTDEC